MDNSIITGLITGLGSSILVSWWIQRINYNRLIIKEKNMYKRNLNRFKDSLSIAILEHEYTGDSRTPKDLLINSPTLIEITAKELEKKDYKYLEQANKVNNHINVIKKLYLGEYKDIDKIIKRGDGDNNVSNEIIPAAKKEIVKLQNEVNNLNGFK